jgi:hypothetical protein
MKYTDEGDVSHLTSAQLGKVAVNVGNTRGVALPYAWVTSSADLSARFRVIQ